ncbi:hypothetical protein HanXRQr2_Chr17g0798541 [Helianthus annuus]|uniref:Uncharacterized protein n=1 Tax=Helianthus annuus TaxID=4232 RepID=A0A9K3DIY6_HELAN|nr:hypothetical protein HanXRQr2_Chr17g0798541 [Helianthus annuus]KAJ0812817.1 hypothetical protein HanPSC8_Chr17g0766231 [Helianthus annuus]
MPQKAQPECSVCYVTRPSWSTQTLPWLPIKSISQSMNVLTTQHKSDFLFLVHINIMQQVTLVNTSVHQP